MLKIAKYTALAIYGMVGISGWYFYESEINRPPLVKEVDVLSADMTINYVRAMVWYHSRGKLQELRSILLNDDLSKHEFIKIRIKNMLMHRSSSYIREFNRLKTPLPGLGSWYQQNFDFDSFLTEVYKVVFDEKLTDDDKIRNVTDIMEEYQNLTNIKLIDRLNKK